MNTNDQNTFQSVEDEHVISEGKTIAIIAYITVIGLVIALVMNNEKKNSFATYHIRQVLGLALCGVVLAVFNVVPILGWFIAMAGFLVLFVMWIMGLMNALNGKASPVFLLGEKFQEWFKGL